MAEPRDNFYIPASADGPVGPDVTRLLPRGILPLAFQSSTDGSSSANIPDLQLTGQPRMSAGGSDSGGNPFLPNWGIWNGNSRNLSLVQRFAMFGPMGGNPWRSSFDSPQSGLAGLLNNSPYSQFGGGLSNQFNPMTNGFGLNGGGFGGGSSYNNWNNNQYSNWGGNQYGGMDSCQNGFGNNRYIGGPLGRIATGLYLINRIAHGGFGRGLGALAFLLRH
jgi:hypothetical protein